ncbi:MAG: D-amino acid dehydrogenase [Phenylobacterium sp.]
MIIVMGAGVIGVTTAYELAKRGHRVLVLDRQPGPALETSFANAGEISPGYASPWAGPGVPAKALKWLTMTHGPLRLRPRLDPYMWLWMLDALSNCTPARYAVNKAAMIALARYSRARLQDLRAETGIAYDEAALGALQLFRTSAQLAGAARDVAILRAEGMAYEVLDADACVAVEPGLAGATTGIAGGLRLVGDETGDCYLFTRRLAKRAAALGVTFAYGQTIQEIRVQRDRIVALRTQAGWIEGEHYIAALGSHTAPLLRRTVVDLPVYPVKGYSLTLPVADAARAPVSTVMDETYKVAITRLGERIRVGGTAEISGFDTSLPDAPRQTLLKSLAELFPGAGDPAAAVYWSGLRPMTPDGPPIVGPTAIKNLHLNTGHGTLGWTMACGSAALIADMLSGVEPEVPAAPYALARFVPTPAPPVSHFALVPYDYTYWR